MSGILPDETMLVRPVWARLRACPVRGAWTLLVPERVLFPCPTTVDLLQRLATPLRLGDMVDDLAREYDAPADVIRADVVALLSDLVEKGYVRRLDS
jgi:pyrroloquinoline quinone biosynthesis protein D